MYIDTITDMSLKAIVCNMVIMLTPSHQGMNPDRKK